MKKSVFVFFWLPYAAKYTYHTFLTAFYIAVNRFPVEQCIHIGPTALFEPPLPGFAEWLKGYGCCLPSFQELSSLSKRTIDPAVFNDVQQQLLSNNLVWKHLLTQRHAGLENELNRTLFEISSAYNIEAILAWGNTPSLSRVAQHYGLKVIHHEMGPLRSPFYAHTAYFDFSGVNGNTEAASRFTNFKNNTDAKQLKALSLKALLSIFGEERYFGEIFKAIPPQFDIGVPLQVEDDSNILAFSNGFNNYEVTAFARSQSERVLIRKHPSGHANYLAIQDNSGSVIEFIKRVNRIITINSSVGFEAMLYEKSCHVLGDSPFAFIANTPDGERDHNLLVAINFFLFGYLIPFKLLFNLEYYRWRLREPSEIEIYNFHLDYYFRSRGLPAPALLSPDQLDVEALARSEKALADLTDIDRNNCNAVDIPTSEQLEGEPNTQSSIVAASSRFISYAQNFEDVMLWRALKHIEGGCYVDVGANDPEVLSVTKAFYDRGWRGINIEPTEQYYRKLLAKRPEDVTIKVAVGDRPGTQTLYEIRDTGLTTVDPTIAKQHQANGWNVVEEQSVVSTLTEILAPYRERDIHFLKIDVEGGEEQALRGMDFSQVRPWVLVIESVLPLTKNPSYEVWEPLLLQAEYKCVYFDGVNRFYVAKEHNGLSDAFCVPPHRYFDDFILASEYDMEIALNATRQELSVAKTATAQAEFELVRTREDLQSKEYERQHLQERLEAVLTSHSWHMTAPIRRGVLFAGRLVGRIASSKRMAIALRLRIGGIVFRSIRRVCERVRRAPLDTNIDLVSSSGQAVLDGRNTSAEALLAQTPVQADSEALIHAIRLRIVEELDSYVGKESRPVSALESMLLGHGLRVDSTVYSVDGLRRLPDPDVLEALSILLFKRPLEKMPTLRLVGRLVHRRSLILLIISVLPGRRARISGLYRRVIRNMLSGSPLLLGLARKIYSKVS